MPTQAPWTQASWKDWSWLVFLTLLMGSGLFSGPAWKDSYWDVCQWSNVLAVLTILLLWVARSMGSKGIRLERWLMAAFLAGMPVIYIVRWLQVGGGGAHLSWIWIECAGFVVFGALTYAGLLCSPWYLAIGIVAHGLAWDIWHYMQHSSYIPDWYSMGCLSADVGLGAYVATRVRVWNGQTV